MGGGTRVGKRYTKGKGKHWGRGKSSSSNPESRKFRDAARNIFFSASKPSGGLTQEALAHHNVFDSSAKENEMDVEGVETESVGAKTFDTFASNWSDCSNPAFDRLIKNWQPSSSAHKEMLAILAAVTEIIKSKGGKETETEYFAALMTALESVDTEERLAACISLLGMILSRIPPSVLKLKFSDTSKALLDILSKYSSSENQNLLKTLIGCLSVVLRGQELAMWENSSTMHIYQAVLSFTTSPLAKVRKAAQHAVCAVLKGSSFMVSENPPSVHPAAAATAKYCVSQVHQVGGESTTTLYILNLLKDVLSVFPHHSLKTSCETILQVMTLSNAVVTAASLQALHSMFIQKPKVTSLPPEVNGQLITALYDYQPSINDPQPLNAWLLVMQEAHVNLYRTDSNVCLLHLPKLLTTAVHCWQSDREEVRSSTASCIKAVLQQCVQPLAEHLGSILSKIPVGTRAADTHAHKIFAPLEEALKYQYHPAWKYVLQILATFFEVAGKHCGSVTRKCLKSMAELRESFHFLHKTEMDFAIGMAIRTMGPQAILESIPLKIDENEDNLDFQRSWLLPVLRDHVQDSELSFFIRYFLPMATICKSKATAFAAESRLVESKTYELIENQFWSLLPGFCTRPTDLQQSFSQIARALGGVLNDRPELRLTVLSSLRLLINNSIQHPAESVELGRFAKNYLPLMFTIYTGKTTDDGVRRAVFDTVKIYLKITDSQLCCSLFDKAIVKLTSDTEDKFTKYCVLDLVRALTVSLDKTRLLKIVTVVLPMLEKSDQRLQKKGYRVVEELCSSSAPSCRWFVSCSLLELKDVLLKSLSTVAPPSKAPRLRCLTHVIKQLQPDNRQFLLDIIPEVVLGLSSTTSSIKARTAANVLLLQLADTLVTWASESPIAEQAALKEFFQLMLSGLTDNPDETCGTILALSSCMWRFKAKISSEVRELVITRVCALLKSNTNRNVQKTVLVFVRQLVIIFRDTDLAPFLELIINTITRLPREKQRALRHKIREVILKLIKKFGADMIGTFVPESLYKMIHHIQKYQSRERRQKAEYKEKKEARAEEKEDDAFSIRSRPQSIEDLLKDSDSELEDEEPRKPASKKPRRKAAQAWIAEDAGEGEVMDLLDPKAAQKITSIRPDQTKTDKSSSEIQHDFKTSSDGRLIITDDGDDSDQEKGTSDQPTTNQLLQALSGPRRKMSGKRARYLDDDEEGEEKRDKKYEAGGRGIHRPVQKKKPAAFGAEYKAKKAGGDMKKKGRPDPYAYIPFNYQVLNRRKKNKFAGQFKNIVRAAKKGASIGKKSKARAERKMKK